MQSLLMQYRMHLVLQPRPLPHQCRPQPHLLPPRLRLPVRLPRLRQQIAAQQMRQRLRVYPVVLQLGRGNRLHPLRMHQHQPLHLRLHHFPKRRPEPARLHRHLHFLAAKLTKILPQRPLLVGHRTRLYDFPSCFQRRHVTESLVKIYSNVDHLVPPSGLVLRARTLPLEARLFRFHYI